jgi:predicted nucleic acid-binding protein
MANFLDTNVVVYAFTQESFKTTIAEQLIRQDTIISTQVVFETANVLIKKHKMEKSQAYLLLEQLMGVVQVNPVTAEITKLGMHISRRYQLSHWDAWIVAVALNSGVAKLYSEDLQHGLLVENALTVLNPFKAA